MNSPSRHQKDVVKTLIIVLTSISHPYIVFLTSCDSWGDTYPNIYQRSFKFTAIFKETRLPVDFKLCLIAQTGVFIISRPMKTLWRRMILAKIMALFSKNFLLRRRSIRSKYVKNQVRTDSKDILYTVLRVSQLSQISIKAIPILV